MKKILAIVLITALALALLAGCGSAPAEDPAAQEPNAPADAPADVEKETISLVIGSGHSARQMDYMEALDDFFIPEVSKRVSEETNYEIEWTTAYGGTVAKLPEMVTAVQDGLLDMGTIATAMVSSQLPLHNYTYILPYTADTPVICYEASSQLYNEFPDELINSFETEYNQKFLGILAQPTYQIYSTVPINSFEDLSGLKIGAAGKNQLWLENTGAVVVQTNMSDNYTSLQTGLIDAVLIAAYWGINSQINEVAPYCIKADLGSHAGAQLTVNLDTWNSLPEEVQTIIAEVANEFQVYAANYALECEGKSYALIEEAGGTIIEFPDEDKAEWLAALPNLPDAQYSPELAGVGQDILSRYLEILEEMGQNIPRDWEFNK